MIAFLPWLEPPAHHVARSLRFNSPDAPGFSRTPGSAGNRKILAGRFRIKRAKLGAAQVIASAGTSSIDRLYFDSSDRLCLDVLGTARLVTTAVFRDPTAWIDVGFELDVGNASAAARAKILVDEAELAYGTDSRSSIGNTDTNWNAAVVHYLGRDNGGNYFDGLIAEPALTDGSKAIAYLSGGVPIAPSATWGTNGFWLPLSDNAAADAAHLGADASGNGNNLTPANLSVAAGVGNDSLVDSPTIYGTDTGAGGEVRGNYPVLSLLEPYKHALSNGALDFLGTTNAYRYSFSTMPLPAAGKFMFEAVFNSNTGADNYNIVGLSSRAFDRTSLPGATGNFSAVDYGTWGNGYQAEGALSGSLTIPAGTRIQCYVDMDALTLRFAKDGVLQTGTGSTVALSGAYRYFPYVGNYGAQSGSINFGQRPWADAPALSGYAPLCTMTVADTTVIASGSFTGNANADGPVVWTNGVPETLTINGNAVTWGTHALKLASGFKVITSSSSYNAAGSNSFAVTAAGAAFKNARAQAN